MNGGIVNKYRAVGLLVLMFASCGKWPAGDSAAHLEHSVETGMNPAVMLQYMDTLERSGAYAVPAKWRGHKKAVERDSVNNRRVYFKSDPEEMYLISFGGGVVLDDVYNGENDGGWVMHRGRVPEGEARRIMARLDQFLKMIELMAKADSIPDSILYRDAGKPRQR